MFKIALIVYGLVALASVIRIVVVHWQKRPVWRWVAEGLAITVFWPVLLLSFVVFWPISKIGGKIIDYKRERRLSRDAEEMRQTENLARAELAAKICKVLSTATTDEQEIILTNASLKDYVEQSVSRNYVVGVVEDVLAKEIQINDFELSYEVALREFHEKDVLAKFADKRIFRYRGEIHFSLSIDANAKLPWAVVMTKHFTKSLAKIDGKLKGKLLNAISEICDDPLTVRGDTIKPLMHDFKDCWRYRIGDFRLIYIPDKHDQKVVLLSFAPRGQVYA